ncbi:hypothetical protein HPG69_018012 [Diceros bicornis minor]|uniref:Uncharacterized protein n=1 Tax=Diceros bicornis minor TaxID=77932 RepID=A0A7J7F7T1_DICBM|nr:hypothetical protein HPG69_018012 [Diceros bicornis minor]
MAGVQILVLVTVGLGSARAGPVPTSKPATARRSCDMGRFKSLLPSELGAFKKAKDALENSLKNWTCSTPVFPRARDLRQLQESQACLEASVMFNLFRLLTRDLNCVAGGDLCI